MENRKSKETEMNTTEDLHIYDIIIDKNNNNETVKLELKEAMDYETLIAIADKISNIVVSDNEYKPEYKKPMFLYYILDKMTNYKSIQTNNIIEINEMFKLIKSPIGQKIEELINEIPSLKELNELVDIKIAFKKEELLHKSTLDELFKSLSILLTTLNKKASEIDTNKLDTVLKKINVQEFIKTNTKNTNIDSVEDKTLTM